MSNSAGPDGPDKDAASKDAASTSAAGQDEPGKDTAGKDEPGKDEPVKDTAAGTETAPPAGGRSLGTLAWLLPAATFLVGLVIGFAVWGASDGDDDRADQAEGTPAVTTPGPDGDNGTTITVAVPQVCLDAIDESERSLDLLEEAAQAISDLDAARLQEIVDELQGAQDRIRTLGEECRASTDVTIDSPPASPTT